MPLILYIIDFQTFNFVSNIIIDIFIKRNSVGCKIGYDCLINFMFSKFSMSIIYIHLSPGYRLQSSEF